MFVCDSERSYVEIVEDHFVVLLGRRALNVVTDLNRLAALAVRRECPGVLGETKRVENGRQQHKVVIWVVWIQVFDSTHTVDKLEGESAATENHCIDGHLVVRLRIIGLSSVDGKSNDCAEVHHPVQIRDHVLNKRDFETLECSKVGNDEKQGRHAPETGMGDGDPVPDIVIKIASLPAWIASRRFLLKLASRDIQASFLPAIRRYFFDGVNLADLHEGLRAHVLLAIDEVRDVRFLVRILGREPFVVVASVVSGQRVVGSWQHEVEQPHCGEDVVGRFVVGVLVKCWSHGVVAIPRMRIAGLPRREFRYVSEQTEHR